MTDKCHCRSAGTMTPHDLKQRIHDEVQTPITEDADNEVAHDNEDRIHRDVLYEVAARNPHAVELAEIALTTYDVEYDRWYA